MKLSADIPKSFALNSQRFAFGIIPNPDMLGLDNSAYKFHCEI